MSKARLTSLPQPSSVVWCTAMTGTLWKTSASMLPVKSSLLPGAKRWQCGFLGRRLRFHRSLRICVELCLDNHVGFCGQWHGWRGQNRGTPRRSLVRMIKDVAANYANDFIASNIRPANELMS